MRKGIIVNVTGAERARIRAVVANRNSPQKHVWRANIILLTADGLGTNAIMRGTGRAKSVVWRWQERFMREGVHGLLRDKTRPPGRKPLNLSIIERVIALTAEDPPEETTHWTAGLMARTVGISVSSVQRIWQAHGLRPHRVRRFKLSKDPEFVPKLREIVGLYVNPPAHAIVLSVDEKSQIQALDRRTPSRYQPLPHGNQCRSQALRLDRSPRPRHCCRAARDPSVRVGALGASAQADGERDIERLSDTDRAPAGKLPNYGRHRPMATPLGSPHLICSTIC